MKSESAGAASLRQSVTNHTGDTHVILMLVVVVRLHADQRTDCCNALIRRLMSEANRGFSGICVVCTHTHLRQKRDSSVLYMPDRA